MPFVPVPKDLNRIKTKIAFNLTKRQLICFGLAAAIGVPAFLLTRSTVGNDVAVLLMIILMLPLFFIAMYEKDGQPAEKILRNILRTRMWPGKRPYQTENLYKYIEEASIGKKQNKTANRSKSAIAKRRSPAKKK